MNATGVSHDVQDLDILPSRVWSNRKSRAQFADDLLRRVLPVLHGRAVLLPQIMGVWTRTAGGSAQGDPVTGGHRKWQIPTCIAVLSTQVRKVLSLIGAVLSYASVRPQLGELR
jgi:hypothetical protein